VASAVVVPGDWAAWPVVHRWMAAAPRMVRMQPREAATMRLMRPTLSI
jgi:hypothetical protein